MDLWLEKFSDDLEIAIILMRVPRVGVKNKAIVNSSTFFFLENDLYSILVEE